MVTIFTTEEQQDPARRHMRMMTSTIALEGYDCKTLGGMQWTAAGDMGSIAARY